MKLLGHRGARFEKPENTMAGFVYALECGMKGIELDVRKTKDGQIVVIHDETIDRTANGEGFVSLLTVDQLSEFDFGEGERIQLLTDVIPAICEKASLYIELKDQSVDEVVEIVEASGFEKQIVIKSFDHRQLRKISKRNPNLTLAALMVCTPSEPGVLARSCGASILSINVNYLDFEFIEKAHDDGILVCGWNCNDLEMKRHFESIGLDWLGTDTPSLFR